MVILSRIAGKILLPFDKVIKKEQLKMRKGGKCEKRVILQDAPDLKNIPAGVKAKYPLTAEPLKTILKTLIISRQQKMIKAWKRINVILLNNI